MTFLSNPTFLAVQSSGHSLVPLAVTTAEVGSECTPASKQLNRLLVTVGPATIMSEPNSFNEISIDDGSGPTQLEDSMTSVSMHISSLITGGPDGNLAGTVLNSVTGVVRYAHVDWEIHPRTAVDIVLAGEATFPTIPTLSPAPPSPPAPRCTDDPYYLEMSQTCSDWQGYDCRNGGRGVFSPEKIQILMDSCPQSCSPGPAHCLPHPPTGTPLPPPPPAPPVSPPAPLQPMIRCTDDPDWTNSRGNGCSSYKDNHCQLLVAVGYTKEEIEELAFSCPESCIGATGHTRHCLPEPPAVPPLSPTPPMPPAIPPAPPSPPPARPPTPAGFQTWSVASGFNCAEELEPSGLMRVSPSKLTLGRAIDWNMRGTVPSSSTTSTSLVGIVFPSIELNETSNIVRTHLVFDVADVEDFSSEALTLRIYGEKSADVPQPTSANADLSSRPRTTATVIWQSVEVSTQKHTLLHSPVPAAMCVEPHTAICVRASQCQTFELFCHGRTSRRLWRRSLASQVGCQATRLHC